MKAVKYACLVEDTFEFDGDETEEEIAQVFRDTILPYIAQKVETSFGDLAEMSLSYEVIDIGESDPEG